MITTTKGDMDESLLIKKTGGIDNDNENTDWVEYYLPENMELVHRSVHVRLKKNVAADGIAAAFG